MVADEVACNPRNPYPGTIYNHKNRNINLYGTDMEVDYRGYDVSVENFLRLLTGTRFVSHVVCTSRDTLTR